jgi:hypothetical protein
VIRRALLIGVASALAACSAGDDGAARDAAQAPIDKAEAVQDTVDAQAQATRDAVAAQADDASSGAADAPASAPPP